MIIYFLTGRKIWASKVSEVNTRTSSILGFYSLGLKAEIPEDCNPVQSFGLAQGESLIMPGESW